MSSNGYERFQRNQGDYLYASQATVRGISPRSMANGFKGIKSNLSHVPTVNISYSNRPLQNFDNSQQGIAFGTNQSLYYERK